MESQSQVKRIQQSAAALMAVRPAYEEIIPFYRDLYIAQEESKIALNLTPIIIPEDQLTLKKGNGFALVATHQFIIDTDQAKRLLEKICTVAMERAPALETSAENLLNALKTADTEGVESDDAIDPVLLFNSLLTHDLPALKGILETLQMPEEHLVLLGFAAMTPAIETCAQQLSHYLDTDLQWDHGTCPVCGSHPGMGYLNDSGERRLVCGFCLHQWKTARTGCALCQNKGQDKQHYFYSDEENEYRVDLCNHCKKYLKMIDLREMKRSFHPQLELVATLHLDMQAMEQGFATVISH